MILLKLYLLGCIIAFIIELITMVRVGNWNRWDFTFMLFATICSWLWVIFFLGWVLYTMGLQYNDIEEYEFVSWRLKRQ